MPDPITPPAAVVPPVVPVVTPAVVPPVAVEPDESKLGDAGKAALKVERDARTKAESDLTEARAALQKIEDAKLSDIQKAQKDADDAKARVTALESQNARLSALATHPVPEEYRDLVTGTDEASYLASAKKISELYARAEGKAQKVGVVHDSGNRNGDGGGGAGTSISAGRDLYASKHPKTS